MSFYHTLEGCAFLIGTAIVVMRLGCVVYISLQ
jgi:hypothetical protein